ncbi:hypothetical protein ZYGR_0AF00840 [Zygosaccharomyces rouxii]|uniref:ADP-ribose 1''-phosphate phosphatase n=1 Tax=Zygosaccharomyces rouxii TaxID=4956 RepID=A0A1Q3A7L9_ZYGRO|nr:hypothetical protein ZYGR_0AF00840 [Zygosaccharomyces rouxii]
MSNVKYTIGNILPVTGYPRILIHSCNCGGSWGGGIAYQLAARYPKAEQVYVDACNKYGNQLLGKCLFIPSYKHEDLIICCLFTSAFGGGSHDYKKSILNYTEQGLQAVRTWFYEGANAIQDPIEKDINSVIKNLNKPLADYKLEMPKINSGIFGVPWEETESVLKEFGAGTQTLNFTVYSL